MSTASPLLIIDVDRTGVFPGDQLAFSLGYEKAELMDTVNDALTAIQTRKPSPHYVVVDIGLHGEDIVPVIASLAEVCRDVAQLVVIGNINDLSFYRRLIKVGVREYFTHPASVSEVRGALVQHMKNFRRRSSDSSLTGTVIAFMSAASGDGSSTIALNTAYSLARESDRDCVLVDMDYQFGMIARQLDLQAQFGIRELFDYPDRGVDATLVSKMLLPYGDSGLNIIAAPDALRMMPTIRQDAVRDLIRVLKTQFRFVILDVPHTWVPWTAEVLAQADKVVVVSQLWLRSLTHLSRLLGAWTDAGIERNKILLSVNRSGARFREGITPQDFERVCLKNINYYFANDIKTVVAAENAGKTIMEMGSSLIERQVREMARSFLTAGGMSFDDEEETEKSEKKGLKGLFGKG